MIPLGVCLLVKDISYKYNEHIFNYGKNYLVTYMSDHNIKGCASLRKTNLLAILNPIESSKSSDSTESMPYKSKIFDLLNDKSESVYPKDRQPNTTLDYPMANLSELQNSSIKGKGIGERNLASNSILPDVSSNTSTSTSTSTSSVITKALKDSVAIFNIDRLRSLNVPAEQSVIDVSFQDSYNKIKSVYSNRNSVLNHNKGYEYKSSNLDLPYNQPVAEYLKCHNQILKQNKDNLAPSINSLMPGERLLRALNNGIDQPYIVKKVVDFNTFIETKYFLTAYGNTILSELETKIKDITIETVNFNDY